MLAILWQDLRFLKQLRHGIYKDDCKGLDPETISHYYGTFGAAIRRHKRQTRAGHSKDEVDDNMDDTDFNEGIAQGIHADQKTNVWHEGISVPDHNSPFHDTNEEANFFNVLANVVSQGIELQGYGLHRDEWVDGKYPVSEFIPVGKVGKGVEVSLADPIWKRRATLWVQAVCTLTVVKQ